MIRAWCVRETSAWIARRPSFAAIAPHLRALNDQRGDLTLFEITPDRVAIVPRSGGWQPDPTSPLGRRSVMYRDFLQAVIQRDRLGIHTMIAMCMGDGAIESSLAPTFSFQKPAGSTSILMPDIDFLHSNFYESPDTRDHMRYIAKSPSAVFTGSTTGQHVLTLDMVRSLSLPRLHSAIYFKDSPYVEFDLPNIVQCDSPETRDAIMALAVPSHRRSWREQFGYRFLISMDGNGASCSRVVIALRSNSVLLKYNSDNILFYFSEMIPWRHYLPVSTDEDVERIIEMERTQPGLFRDVAEQGKEFYRKHLTRSSVFDYTSTLLRTYAELFA